MNRVPIDIDPRVPLPRDERHEPDVDVPVLIFYGVAFAAWTFVAVCLGVVLGAAWTFVAVCLGVVLGAAVGSAS